MRAYFLHGLSRSGPDKPWMFGGTWNPPGYVLDLIKLGTLSMQPIWTVMSAPRCWELPSIVRKPKNSPATTGYRPDSCVIFQTAESLFSKTGKGTPTAFVCQPASSRKHGSKCRVIISAEWLPPAPANCPHRHISLSCGINWFDNCDWMPILFKLQVLALVGPNIIACESPREVSSHDGWYSLFEVSEAFPEPSRNRL